MEESTQRYALGEKLHQGRRASVYRAVRKADGHKVVLRVLDGNDPVAGKIERLKHELDLRSTLHGLPAVEPLALSTLNGAPALELEDFVGEPLDRLVTAPLAVEDFLPLAVSVAAAVGDIHSRGLIHKDLNPGSILFDPQTRRVKVANFGAASRVAREQTAAGPERLLEESLPYVSPELTGRMNRAVDSRSDLYSLGITYYQLLTGRLPFTASDAIGWVHCHVARKPAPPVRFRDALPSVLSEIVLKLLAKVPDDRYQSAAGLQRDLERCLRQWRETGTITPFALGAEDTSDRFLVPQTVYGREAECAALREAFERVVATGQPELVLVSGPSGIGKSAVVYELRRPIIGRQGFFLSAKFERGKRDIPYLAVIRAFRELALDILTESAEQISAWRRRIIDALGPNGRLIVDLLPEIELIIGPQPEPPALPLGDAENRLRMVVRQFVCAFARPDHPLTLFLDDLQWVDAASANLVADLATDPDTRHVLLIGTSRSDEVPAAQPLAATLDKLRASGAVVREIALGAAGRGRGGPARRRHRPSLGGGGRPPGATGAREDRRQSVLRHPLPDGAVFEAADHLRSCHRPLDLGHGARPRRAHDRQRRGSDGGQAARAAPSDAGGPVAGRPHRGHRRRSSDGGRAGARSRTGARRGGRGGPDAPDRPFLSLPARPRAGGRLLAGSRERQGGTAPRDWPPAAGRERRPPSAGRGRSRSRPS